MCCIRTVFFPFLLSSPLGLRGFFEGEKGGKKAQVISCDKSVGLLGKLLSYSGDLGLLRPLDAHRRLEEGGRSRREVGEEEPVRGDLLPSP